MRAANKAAERKQFAAEATTKERKDATAKKRWVAEKATEMKRLEAEADAKKGQAAPEGAAKKRHGDWQGRREGHGGLQPAVADKATAGSRWRGPRCSHTRETTSSRS